MYNIKRKNRIILGLLIIISISLISNSFISFSYAQTNGEAIQISSYLGCSEYSEIKGVKENVSSIDLQLPEANWTVTNIKVNFSDISLGSEINTIEDTETGFDYVYHKNWWKCNNKKIKTRMFSTRNNGKLI